MLKILFLCIIAYFKLPDHAKFGRYNLELGPHQGTFETYMYIYTQGFKIHLPGLNKEPKNFHYIIRIHTLEISIFAISKING